MAILKDTYKKAPMKSESGKSAPVAKPHKAIEHLDGGGMQTSANPRKNQTRIMRFIKR